jgi:hypothetical protein
MTAPVGSVNVEVTGTVSGLIDAMDNSATAVSTAGAQMSEALDRAAATSTEAAETIKRSSEESASAFEGLGRRFQTSGVMIAFAVMNMADGMQLGVQRALRSIALLGFAFGPVVGSITTGVALALEAIDHLVHESEKKVEDFQKKVSAAIDSGDLTALLKQKELLLTGKPTDESGGLVPASDLVAGAFKGSLEDLEAHATKTKEAFDRLGLGGLLKVTPELATARAELEKLNKDIAAAEDQRDRLARSGDMPKITITADSGKREADEKKKKAAEALALEIEFGKLSTQNDESFAKLKEKILDGSMKTTEEEAHRRMKVNDDTNREEAESAVAFESFMEQQAKQSAARVEAEQKHQAEIVAEEWTNAFHEIDTALLSSYEKMKRSGGTFVDFMRDAGRQLLQEEIRNELRIEEAHLARVLSGQTAEDVAKTKSLATSAATAIAWIGNEAAKGAASAWAAMEAVPVVGPFLAPAAAAAALAGIIALASHIHSAAGGFDIPAGLNPVTQLHAQEMVLPAHLANAVRSMAGGGATGGTVHIHAVDSVDVGRWAGRNDNAAALHRGITKHVQNGGAVTSAVGRRAP